jgi:hypothetical protein
MSKAIEIASRYFINYPPFFANPLLLMRFPATGHRVGGLRRPELASETLFACEALAYPDLLRSNKPTIWRVSIPEALQISSDSSIKR